MSVTDGMAMGWTSPMIPYFLSEESHIKMTRSQAEWLETYLLFGAICGLPITAYVTEKIGRRKSLMVACSILVITWVVLAVGDRVEYLSISRFFQGIGLNMAFVAAPMYVGEISHKNIRGFLSSMIFIMNVIGIVIMYATGPFLPYYVNSIIASVILIVEIIAFIFMPESPHFLTTKGKHEAAKKSLKKFRRYSHIDEELFEIRHAIEEENQDDKAPLKELLVVKNYRKSLIIMSVLNSGQLFCSFEVILMNLHEILSSAGSIYVSAATAGILFSVMNLIAATASSLLVDRFGRVKLLIISTILTGMCLLTLAVYFHLHINNFDTQSYSWLPIVSVMMYGLLYRIGLGMVPIVMTCELFASRIKSYGITISDGIYVLSSITALQIFFILRDNFGLYLPFYVFFGCSIFICVFVIYFVPETKGRSLEEIQKILRNEPLDEIDEHEKIMYPLKQ